MHSWFDIPIQFAAGGSYGLAKQLACFTILSSVALSGQSCHPSVRSWKGADLTGVKAWLTTPQIEASDRSIR